MAYKFQLGAAILSGNLTQEGAVAVQNDSATTVVSLSKAGAVSGASGVSAASLTINGSAIVSQAKALANVTTISGAAALSAASLNINGIAVATQAGALRAATSVSGAGLISAANISTDGTCDGKSGISVNGTTLLSSGKALQNVTTISGAGAAQAGTLAARTVSSSAGLSGATLTINGSSIVTQAKALGNVISISGAGTVSAAALTINGSAIVSQAKALGNVTTISGAGAAQAGTLNARTVSSSAGLAGSTLTINNSVILAQTRALANVISISGAGSIQGASIQLKNESDIGVTGDTDLMELSIGVLEVNGQLSASSHISGAANLTIVGTSNFAGLITALSDVKLSKTTTAAIDAADFIVAKDSVTSNIITRTRTNFVSDMAGAGLTATAGVLSTQAGTATSASTRQLLSEGYNYFGNIAAPTVCALPSGSKGDVVWVKAATGVTQTNYIIISSSQKDSIDGNTVSASCPKIESPYGAVGFLYVGESDWRIL